MKSYKENDDDSTSKNESNNNKNNNTNLNKKIDLQKQHEEWTSSLASSSTNRYCSRKTFKRSF